MLPAMIRKKEDTMKILKLVFLSLVLLACSPPQASVPVGVSRPTATWSVFFSPNGGCTNAVVGLIGGAKTSVHMLAYTFTSQSIVDALVAAKGKSLDVQVIVDRTTWDAPTPTTKVVNLVTAGIPVFVDRKHAIAHNKTIVVDGLHVETGSFNYTQEAETGNAENCLILTNGALAAEYETNWLLHQSHSSPAP